jgi:3-phenylpropionate/trans-cinnamate dioxygenase ferredoxin subunit
LKLVGRVKLEVVKTDGLVRLTHPPFDVLVAWDGEKVYAIEDACNHAGASLAEGWLEPDHCIVCPMHGYVFDLADGKLLRPEGLCGDQRTYIARVEGEDVAVYDPFELVVLG